MKKFNHLFLLLIVLLIVVPVPSVRAIDPITMMILAPIAVKVAEAARPYIIQAGINFGKGLVHVIRDTFQILYLPYGLCKMTFGAPFGGFRSGLKYTIKGGAIAPAKLIVHTLMLPVYAVGGKVRL